MADLPLHHVVHPFVLVADDAGHQMCICGLWDTHHLHEGISSATCTCMECAIGREGKSAWLYRSGGDDSEARP